MAYTVDPLDPSTPIDSEGMGYGAEEFRLLKQRINDLETTLNSADTTLQDNIDAEAITRGSADTTLQGNIDLKLAIASNLSDVANALTSFNNIKQNASETYAGVVEEATSGEMSAGSGGKFPDCATVKGYYGEVQTTKLGPAGNLTGGSCRVSVRGNQVTISGALNHSSGSLISSPLGYIPAYARPDSNRSGAYFASNSTICDVWVESSGYINFRYLNLASGASENRTSTYGFTLCYCLDD